MARGAAMEGRRGSVWLAALALAAGALAADADAPFAILEVSSPGRTVAAHLVDLDGDALGDLVTVGFRGVPPKDRRDVHVFFQRPDGSLPETADATHPLPAGSAAYDLLEGDSPAALVLLRPDRLTLLSFAGRVARERDLPLPTPALHFSPDERGLDRIRLARRELGAPARFLVPGLGQCAVLDRDGAVLGLLAVGARANYFSPPRPGPLISESETEMYLDFPRLGVGDVDGDGRGDVVASGRHEVRVFLQGRDGRFASKADRVYPLKLMGESDHIRGSGSVRTALADLDGDGHADLVLSRVSGGVLNVKAETRIHRNRGEGWNLAVPDQRFESEGGAATIQLIDLDRDHRPELVDVRIPVSVVEIVELLVTRSLDVVARVYRAGPGGRFEETPWIKRSYDIGLNFDTFRPRGFIPTLDADLNGDTYPDLLSAADGEALEVYLGGPEHRFARRAAVQALPTSGRLRFGHYDRDGLTDFALYDPRAPGTPVRIGINRGALPGTRVAPALAPRRR